MFRVVRVEPGGDVTQVIAIPSPWTRMRGIAFDEEGRLYVCDSGHGERDASALGYRAGAAAPRRGSALPTRRPFLMTA